MTYRRDKIELNQESIDRGHDLIDELIYLIEKLRVKACNAHQTDARDVLDEVGGHVRIARGKAGKLSFDGGFSPRSGGK